MKVKHMLALILGLVAGIVVLRISGARRWAAATQELHTQLAAARQPGGVKRYHPDELQNLPAPVQRYFRAVLPEGQPIITAVTLEHTGTFNLSEAAEQWMPFTSSERIVIQRPGFVWTCQIAFAPGVNLHVHDAYIAGAGILHASVAGLVSVVNLRDTGELARAELMRFAAEAPWYPTALLPSQGVQWAAVDDTTATATFTDHDVTFTIQFRFNADGLIETIRAADRGRAVADAIIPTPWECRFSDYAQRDGMRIPITGEVAWELPAGPRPYWRGRITRVHYACAT